MKKKIFAGLLAVVMMVLLAVPAMALMAAPNMTTFLAPIFFTRGNSRRMPKPIGAMAMDMYIICRLFSAVAPKTH